MTEGTGKIEFKQAFSMWRLLLWRSFVVYLLLLLVLMMLLLMLEQLEKVVSLRWLSYRAALLIVAPVLSVFAIQLLVQQMIRKRYRTFSLSVMDEASQESRSRNNLTVPERFKVVWALFWRIAPVIIASYALFALPRFLGFPQLSSFRNHGNYGSVALMFLVPPFGVRAALSKRYSTFEVRLVLREKSPEIRSTSAKQ